MGVILRSTAYQDDLTIAILIPLIVRFDEIEVLCECIVVDIFRCRVQFVVPSSRFCIIQYSLRSCELLPRKAFVALQS